MPSFDELKPFLVLGLALGGVFAMSGVGLVVLYRATGVLNLAYGAIGAIGALISWSLLGGWNRWLAFVGLHRSSAARSRCSTAWSSDRPSRRGTRSSRPPRRIGLLLILLGHHAVGLAGLDRPQLQPADVAVAVPDGGVRTCNWTQILGMVFPIVVTVVTARSTCGSRRWARRCGRWPTTGRSRAVLGVPVRRVEAAAWLGSGLVCGTAGLLLGDLVGLDTVTLTFFVIPALAAALIGQLRSLWVTLHRRLRHRSRPVLPDRVLRPGPVPDDDAVRPRHHRPAVVRPALGSRRAVVSRQTQTLVRTSRPWSAMASSSVERRPPAPRSAPGAGRRGRPARSIAIAVVLVLALFAVPALAQQLLAAGDDRRRHLQRRHPRPRPADRSRRHGLAVPVRARGASARGWRCGSSYATSLPFPVLAAHRRPGHGRDRHADRPPGAAPLRPVPGAHHADGGRRAHHPPADRRSSPTAAAGSSATPRPAAPRRCSPALHRQGRHRVLPLLRGRRRAHVPRSRRGTSGGKAGRAWAVDPPEPGHRGRRGRQHDALQAVGVRAGLVLRRRRWGAAGGLGRWRQHQPVPGLELGRCSSPSS